MRTRLILPALAAAVFLGSCHVFAGDAGGQVTNADVVAMVRGNQSYDAIVARLRSAVNNFDLSTSAVIGLKEQGVPDEVIAAMHALSARSAFTGGNLPARGVGGIPDLAPPALSQPGQAAGSFPGMETLGVPSLPAATPASRGAADFSLPPLTATPAPTTGGFTVPSVDSPATANDFYSAPAPAPAVTPAASPAPAFSRASDGATPGSGSADGYEHMKTRFDAEIANVMADEPEKKMAAVAWMLANQQYTLDFLREAMVKSDNPELEAAAVYSLSRLRDAEAIPEIRRRLVSRTQRVRESAAEALAFMEDTDAITAAEKSLTQRVEPMDGLIRLVGHARLVRASGNLGKILAESTVPANRVAAAWALSQIGRAATAAWPAMKQALTSDRDAGVRREAARAVASFHDENESGTLLEAACRKDPDVRRVALEGLADYPESIPFLVSVMNLSADQIAGDELEAARSSLFKLTGEDFSFDGPRWKQWLADNRTRLGLPPPPGALADADDGKVPAGMIGGPARLAGGRPRQVDVRSWGIVADPVEIPLAPEVDETPGTRSPVAAPGFVGLPPGLTGGPAGLGGGVTGSGGAMGPALSGGDDFGPAPAGVGGSLGGGLYGGGGGGGAGGGLTAGSSSLPPPGSIAGRFDDSPAVEAASPASGGDALSGMRLPLPSGLLGASADDAPPIPVGTGAGIRQTDSAGPSAFSGGLTGIGGTPGTQTGGTGFSDDGFSPEGFTTMPSGTGYSAGTTGGSIGAGIGEGFTGLYEPEPTAGDSYSSGGDDYTQVDPIVLPAPGGFDAYGTDSSDGQGMGDWTTAPRDAGVTGDSYGYDAGTYDSGTTAATDGGWDGTWAEDDGYVYESGSYDDDVIVPSASTGMTGGTAPEGFAPTDANVISFPGDQSTFGLGEPLFNEYGQPSTMTQGDGQGEMQGETYMPPPAGMGAGTGMVLPPPTGDGMVPATPQFDDFDEEDFAESEGFDDYEEYDSSGTGYDTGTGTTGYGDTPYGTVSDPIDMSDFDAMVTDENGYVQNYPTDAAGGGTYVDDDDAPASPPASTLKLPARKRRRTQGESVIVSEPVPETLQAEPVTQSSSPLPVPPTEPATLTGPYRIVDREGRTTAIVMNEAGQPPSIPLAEGESYVTLDDTDPYVSGSPLPIPVPGQPLNPPTASEEPAEDIPSGTSPSQTPGRNFRPKK